jgi:4-hydroxy-3-polyprenylbenzoate decarboxylase
MQHRIVVAVTGASGSIYARQLLNKLQAAAAQIDAVAVVMTENAKTVWKTELGDTSYEQLPFRFYAQQDFYAPFASGSGQFNTMIICPCSAGTLGRIAAGISNDLITRAADVILKERRRLICMVRETPYNLMHIRNMLAVTEAGGIVCPATPSFYSKPANLEEVAATVVDRLLDLAGIDQTTYRWGSDKP